MSMSFEVFPTKQGIPVCDDIIDYSAILFNEFLQQEKIACDIEITASELSVDNQVRTKASHLVSTQNNYTVFEVNKEGGAYVFYHNKTKLDKDFWNDELKENRNAQRLKEKIEANLKLGYSWSVKRTMGQPAVVSLYYGYLAIAIAVLTDGIIYSDDGAWDYAYLPVEGNNMKDRYLNIAQISDITVKENIETWIEELKNSYSDT